MFSLSHFCLTSYAIAIQVPYADPPPDFPPPPLTTNLPLLFPLAISPTRHLEDLILSLDSFNFDDNILNYDFVVVTVSKLVMYPSLKFILLDWRFLYYCVVM
ncbi:hypothetical protein ACFE04_026356 [Oxalis oulophora]